MKRHCGSAQPQWLSARSERDARCTQLAVVQGGSPATTFALNYHLISCPPLFIAYIRTQ